MNKQEELDQALEDLRREIVAAEQTGAKIRRVLRESKQRTDRIERNLRRAGLLKD